MIEARHSDQAGWASSNTCDVLVIGGGPAGSTISALLAEKGWQVLVLEKDYHPRFHIGESLLPETLRLFERLGILGEVERIGIRKYGAHINSLSGDKQTTFYFDQALDHIHGYAFEVCRSEFDHLLFKNSAAKGAVLCEGVSVTDVKLGTRQTRTGVTARDKAGNVHHWNTRFLVDASGRDTFLAKRLAIKRNDRSHSSAAIFGHFEGAERLPGRDEGNISIFWFEHGWFWMIPLRDGVMSVGAVCWPYYLKSRIGAPEEFLWKTIALCPGVMQRLKNARLISPVTATGNYSYKATRMVGDGYIMIGDAFAFVDPIFSSGVHLAMNSAFLGAQVVDAYLRQSHAYTGLVRHFDRSVRCGLSKFSWFIHRATTPAMQALFLEPCDTLRMRDALISVLAGDVYRNNRATLPLFLFKLIYYIKSAFLFRESYNAYRQRKVFIRS